MYSFTMFYYFSDRVSNSFRNWYLFCMGKIPTTKLQYETKIFLSNQLPLSSVNYTVTCCHNLSTILASTLMLGMFYVKPEQCQKWTAFKHTHISCTKCMIGFGFCFSCTRFSGYFRNTYDRCGNKYHNLWCQAKELVWSVDCTLMTIDILQGIDYTTKA